MATVNVADLGSVESVRYELGDTDEELDVGLLSYHLGRAQQSIAGQVGPNATPTAKAEDAIVLDAALRVISAKKDFFVEAKGGPGLGKDWDIESWISTLTSRRDDALKAVTGTGTPRLRTFGSRATRTGWR